MFKLSKIAILFYFIFCAGKACLADEEKLDPKLEKAFSRIGAISRQVEQIRGLRFKEDIPAEVQSMDEMREYVKKEVSEQFGEDEIDGFIRSFVKLGALKETVDFVETYLSLLESQAIAHYDPNKKKYFLLKPDISEQLLDVTTSHELCHALQDQYYGLEKYMEDESLKNNNDEMSARQSVVEGEATLVMTRWMMVSQAGGAVDDTLADMTVSAALKMQAALDYDTMIAMSKSQTALMGDAGADMSISMEGIDDIPRIFVESMFSAYMNGAVMIDFVKAHGGWDAVGDLFINPPLSTEQVLHPEKLIGKRDNPVKIDATNIVEKVNAFFQDNDDWALVNHDVMGELGIRIYLNLWQPDDARNPRSSSVAAEGWGGDRFVYFENRKTEKDLMIWATVWDSLEHAREFAVAYRLSLRHRFPEIKKVVRERAEGESPFHLFEVSPGRFLKMSVAQNRVTVVDTTDETAVGFFLD